MATGNCGKSWRSTSERPMGLPLSARLGRGRNGPARANSSLTVDAELVVFGAADPDSHVTLRGEPVRLQPDGSFMVRFSLPDRRQVLPIVASSARRRTAHRSSWPWNAIPR